MRQDTGRPVPRPTLEWSEVGSEVVILDRVMGELLRLNAAGGFIWMQLDGTRTAKEIAERVARHFVTDIEGATRDVREFLGRLRSLGLIA